MAFAIIILSINMYMAIAFMADAFKAINVLAINILAINILAFMLMGLIEGSASGWLLLVEFI